MSEKIKRNDIHSVAGGSDLPYAGDVSLGGCARFMCDDCRAHSLSDNRRLVVHKNSAYDICRNNARSAVGCDICLHKGICDSGGGIL